jgi:regulator of G-protein signaling
MPTTNNGGAPTVNTLDEITNKVFNELLQGKVEAQGMQNGISSNTREGSVKSDDWGSEASSSGIFGRIRRRDSSAPNSNRGDGKSKKNPSKSSAGGSEDGNDSNNGMKKPLIAKWKAGVKLQVTNRNQNDELLEGLKRAQRSRLEDQRGTEINFELPDFLKDKEKYQASNANKLRKTKFDETPSNSVSLYSSNSDQVSSASLSPQRPPQPAPRLSIVGAKSPSKSESMGSVQAKINSLENSILMNCSPGSSKNLFMSPSRSPIDTLNLSTQCIPSNTPMRNRKPESPIYNQPIYYSPDGGVGDSTMVLNHQQLMNSSFESYASESANEHHDYQEIDDSTRRDSSTENGDLRTTTPPPLPPKPRNLPIKPSNWGQNNNKENLFKVPQELPRRVLNTNQNAEMKNDVYLDQPTSSFV